jgi:hypothetical protein
MGLFVEGHTLFSVGNLTSLFAAMWPLCWSTHEVCNENWIASVGYLEIVGIILGGWLHRRLDWSAMGHESGCGDHVYWDYPSYCDVG